MFSDELIAESIFEIGYFLLLVNELTFKFMPSPHGAKGRGFQLNSCVAHGHKWGFFASINFLIKKIPPVFTRGIHWIYVRVNQPSI